MTRISTFTTLLCPGKSLDTWHSEFTPKHERETLTAFAAQTVHHELLRTVCRNGRPPLETTPT